MPTKPTTHAPRATRPRVAHPLLVALLLSHFLLSTFYFLASAQQFQDPSSTTELNLVPRLPATLPPLAPPSAFQPFSPSALSSDDDADAIATTRPEVIAALFRRSNLSRVTLSPDGNYLACVTKGPAPKIVVVKTSALTDVVSVKSLPKDPGTNAIPPLTWLGWLAPARLVAAVDIPFRYVNGSATGVLLAMNADGSANSVLLTPRDVEKVGFLSTSETPASQLRQMSAASGLLPSVRSEIEVLSGDDFSLSSSPNGYDPLTEGPDAYRGMIQDASPRFGGDTGLGDSFGRAFGNQPKARDQPPRSVSVIGYCDDDPQSILVRAQSLLAYGIYKLNVITGKSTKLSEQLPDAISNILKDRQGRVAIEQPRTNDKRFPHAYRYVGTATRKGTLDAIFARTARAPTTSLSAASPPLASPSALQTFSPSALSFSVSPDNVFAHRSIPLGFDADPAILYYASNVGRDTYGIYAVNLKTGAPVPLGNAVPPGNAGVPSAGEGRPAPRPIQNPVSSKATGSTSKIQNLYAIEDPGDTRDLFIPPVTGFPTQSPLVWNRHTGKVAGIMIEGSPRTTRWFNPAFQNLQHSLEKRLPGRTVNLLEWSAGETKFLIYADGPSDPGAYYIYDTTTRKLTSFASLNAALNEHTMPVVSEINFTTPAGVRLTGVLTMPAEFQTKTIPVIILCPPTPWTHRSLDYNPETLMLASLGYIVVELNPRLAPGHGLKNRQPTPATGLGSAGVPPAGEGRPGPRPILSSEATGSTNPKSKIQNSTPFSKPISPTAISYPATATVTYVEDILAIIDELSKHFPINPKRISLIGESYGGYIALRALQLHGDRFSCAVAIDAPVNPAKWLDAIKLTTGESEPLLCASYYDTPRELKAAPLIKQTRLIQKPIYVLNRYVMPREGRDGTSVLQPGEDMYDDAQKLVDQQQAYGVDSLFEPIGGRSRAVLLSDAEKFIRSVQTNARVIFGPIRVIEDPPAAPAGGARRAKAKSQSQN